MANPVCRYRQLNDWYQSRAGAAALPLLQGHLVEMQKGLAGDCALYCGPQSLLDAERISGRNMRKCIYVHPESGRGQLQARPEALPFAPESLDLLLLAHALELSDDPHEVLRQADAALAAGGCLLLALLNPWSCYGARRLWPSRRCPWNRHFYGLRRIQDWLSVLRFRIEDCRYAGFRPPVQSAWLQRRLLPLDTFQYAHRNFLGGLYCVRARKLRVPLTAERKAWYRSMPLLPELLPEAEPAARGISRRADV